MAIHPRHQKNDSLLQQLIRWIRLAFGTQKHVYKPPQILKEEVSETCRLLLLERDQPRAIRTWRSIPRYAEGYDLLISCDTLEALPLLGRGQTAPPPTDVSGAKSPVFRGHIFATHRISVLRISRFPGPSGRVSIKCLWMADLDLLGGIGLVANVGNRYAIAITDGAAKLLLKYEDQRLDWGDVFIKIIQHYMGLTHQPFPDEYKQYLSMFESSHPDFAN